MSDEPVGGRPGLAPPEVQAAAAVVENWLAGEEKRTATPEELARMSDAERIDYCRRFDQSRMPTWRDPRKQRGPT